MKKISINLLCILIIGILSVSVLLPAYYLGSNFTEGLRVGYEMGSKDLPIDNIGEPVDIYFEPSTNLIVNPKDSITFDDGRRLPVVVKQASVLMENGSVSRGPILISEGCYLVSLLCLVLLIIQFVKFIININRGKIFIEDNVIRLGMVAVYLIFISILNVVIGVCQECLVSSLGLSLEGYHVSAYWTLPLSNLLLGLLALLVAQVWSRGIKLEEELRLTV